MSRCSQQALDRWVADAFRFPPYQYLLEHGVVRGDKWRYVDSEEREALLGYTPLHTSTCYSTGDAKAHPIEFMDDRLSLLGNRFHTGVAAYFMQAMLNE